MQNINYAQPPANLDTVFSALADPTRRVILSRLADGEASETEISAPFDISQPAVSKHLRVLEKGGLIERGIDDQRRPAKLTADSMINAVKWLTQFNSFSLTSLDQLDAVLDDMKRANDKGARDD